MKGFKVVTAEEMVRLEKLSYAEGASDFDFMERAGQGIAEATQRYVSKNGLEQRATLLIGKGNNGGDGYAAGRRLIEAGFDVTAYHLFPLDTCSALCRKQHALFQTAGGVIHLFYQDPEKRLSFQGIILDGIFGTGFKGRVEGLIAAVIDRAHFSKCPILSIDIPSGVNGTTGEVLSTAIKATETLFLGLPKIGFFIGSGWNHIGELIPVDFGLPQHYIQAARTEAHLIDETLVPALFPPIQRDRHKYEAGYLLAVAGSQGMMGAALLSSYAALRSGAGIVRLFHPIGCETSQGPLEVIRESWDFSLKPFIKESLRATSVLIGPGLGRHRRVEKMVKSLLSILSLPSILDADVLYFLAEYPHWHLPNNAILTPHRGEMKRILGEEPSLSACQSFVEAKKTTLVLKGAPTFIFHPEELPLIVPRGDPGMATAGSGDVLSGIIGGLLAQKAEPYSAACLGVYLHALAGESAAVHKTSYSLIASDIIEALPTAYKRGTTSKSDPFPHSV